MARALSAAAVVLLAGAGAPARGELPPPYGGRIVASLLAAPTGFDPVKAQTWTDLEIVGLVFDALYRTLPDGTVAPALAEGMPAVSADGREARVLLKRGVRFHGGRALKPSDVVASLQRAQKAPLSEWALSPVKRITADGDTIVFALKRSMPELVVRLALPQLSITPGGRAPGAAPVGTGAFGVRALSEGERRLELTAAADHFAGRPFVDTIVLRWFLGADDEARGYEAGDADLSLRGAVAFEGHEPKYPTDELEGPRLVLVHLGFGKAHPELLADPGFRRGVSLALNRAGFRNVGSGEKVAPAVLPESPDLGGRPPAQIELAARSPDALAAFKKAAQRRPELEAGLSQRGSLTLELIVDQSRPDDLDLAARVVTALDRAGLTLKYQALPAREFARRARAGQCDLYLDQLVPPSPDLLAEYAAAFAAGGDRWPIRRLEEGKLTRESAAAAFQERLPIIPLLHRGVRAHHRQLLRNLAFDALGRLGLADAFVLYRLPEELAP